MKKVIMLHGWFNGDISDMPEFLPDSEENWMGWAKKELEKEGYNVTNPFLRYCYKSEYEEWKEEIEKLDIDEDTILVGWSSGGAFWVRWLGETKKQIKKLILVAAANVNDQTDEDIKEIKKENRGDIWDRFHDFKTDSNIKDRVKNGITVFVSDDADWLVKSSHIYVDKFNAKLIEIKNQGHFENHRRPSPEFPELLDEILNS
jgi:predicted alpha/beta hydrolase family esterase